MVASTTQLAVTVVALGKAEQHAAALRRRRDQLIRELAGRFSPEEVAALAHLSVPTVKTICARSSPSSPPPTPTPTPIPDPTPTPTPIP